MSRFSAKPIALGGVLAALALVIMCFIGIIPVATYICPMLCILICAVVLRYCGSYPEGVGWAILTMNCCGWLLDRIGTPRRFGEKPYAALRAAWDEVRDTAKQLIQNWMPIVAASQSVKRIPEEQDLLMKWASVADYE